MGRGLAEREHNVSYFRNQVVNQQTIRSVGDLLWLKSVVQVPFHSASTSLVTCQEEQRTCKNPRACVCWYVCDSINESQHTVHTLKKQKTAAQLKNRKSCQTY